MQRARDASGILRIAAERLNERLKLTRKLGSLLGKFEKQRFQVRALDAFASLNPSCPSLHVSISPLSVEITSSFDAVVLYPASLAGSVASYSLIIFSNLPGDE